MRACFIGYLLLHRGVIRCMPGNAGVFAWCPSTSPSIEAPRGFVGVRYGRLVAHCLKKM